MRNLLRSLPVRNLALVAATATVTSAVLLSTDIAAQTPAPAAPAAQAPQMVSGLPDFTNLVDQVGPAVVNVEANIGGGASDQPSMDEDEEMPEFFKRFFGPGMPMPQMPPGGRDRGVSMGTGFIISNDGYVLTNHHVVDGAGEVTVRLSDRREFKAKVVGSDEQSDVALLKIPATGLPSLRVGDSRTLRPGQWVVAIGSPFGLDHSVTAGIVSAVGRSNPYANQQYVPFIQTDVAINRGNSGGPLLDTRGQVVGINSQIFSNSGGYMGVSFAIPIDVAMNAVDQLKSKGRVSRGLLGIGLEGIDNEQARALGLPDTRGALVREVQPGSGAAKAGVQRLDVIRAFNGTPIEDASSLPPLVGALPPGAKTTLSIMRDGKARDVTVVLGELAVPEPRAIPASVTPAPNQRNPLGIVGDDIDGAQRRRLGLDTNEGVAIARIEGLSAKRAGLQAGDIILAVGRNSVGSVAQLDRELAALKPGDTAMLLVQRGGTSRYIAVSPRAAAETQ
ncbi:Periplasmic protease [Lysobacter dokdonensis DS-58]|uniref:Probable periplasmic serine endoprotease DegP-like n=1 Tax=Lysobacter dokdonensis DS-58 TaxID=1300345 RepID=A0A0A2WGM9_9GAMM|nr:Periplasmic protease [Lysobacter dokdonensis DS-58]